MCGKVKLSPRVMPDNLHEQEASLADIVKVGAALAGRPTQVEIFDMQWGIKLPLGKPVFHARYELVADKPMWSHLFVNGRGVLYTMGWYEKNHFVYSRTGAEMALAVLWSRFPSMVGKHFVMLTQSSEGRLARIHERMPVLVNPTEWFASGITLGPDEIDVVANRESHA